MLTKPLKIVILGESEFETNGFHIAESLNFLGHKATIITYKEGLPWYLNTKLTQKVNYYLIKGSYFLERQHAETIAKLVEKAEPDLVITIYRNIHPSLIPKLRKSLPLTKFVHINSDHLSNFERQQLFVSDYDIYFVKDPFMLDFFKNQLGLNSFLLSEYCNPRVVKIPKFSKAEQEKSVKIDASIFGNIYPYRSIFIENIINNNINLKVFGAKGPYMPRDVEKCFTNEYLIGSRKAEVLYGSKIIFNNFHYAEIEGVNQKFFEIFGAGGCQICTYKEIIKNYSPIDPELFTFKNNSEAIEKANYYLINDDKRFEISKIMSEFFTENHTIDIRMKEVLDKVYGGE